MADNRDRFPPLPPNWEDDTLGEDENDQEAPAGPADLAAARDDDKLFERPEYQRLLRGADPDPEPDDDTQGDENGASE